MTESHTPYPVSLQVSAGHFDEQEPEKVIDQMLEVFPLTSIMMFHNHHLRRTEGHRGGTMFRHPSVGIDDKGRDLFDRLREVLEPRDMGIILGMGEDAWGYQDRYPGYSTIAMVDCYGQTHRQSCVNNPAWRNFQIAAMEDTVREHPYLESIMFMHERSGPLHAMFYEAGYGDGRFPYCFCEHCCRKGRERGIDPNRAREGYIKLLQLVDSAVAGDPAPPEGWFLSIWRLFLRYSEILAWDQLWWDSLHDYRAAVSGAVKALRLDVKVGFHYQHAVMLNSFLWKAGDDPERIAQYADWVKPSVYPGCSGARARNQLGRAHKALFRDLTPEVARDFVHGIMGHSAEDTPDYLAQDGQLSFHASWVEKAIRRYKESQPRPVHAGLGIGVPGGDQAETVDQITACTEACFNAGADGILFSREFREMRPEIARAAGDVIRRRT